MKTIGMLGGMSWESTTSYYKAINQGIKTALGGLHSAKIAMYSVDFDEIEQLQQRGLWGETAGILTKAAQAVEASGADFLLICTNTMHKVAPEIEGNINIPLLHIADATAQQLLIDKIKTVGLLGTRFTMEQGFIKDRITEQFGIDVIVPHEQQQTIVHDVIYDELCRGVIKAESKQHYLDIVTDLSSRGAEAIILGCTEIGLLIQQTDTAVTLYDTTEIHADAAVKMALTEYS
jgi:aspartate racemase